MKGRKIMAQMQCFYLVLRNYIKRYKQLKVDLLFYGNAF